MSDDLKEIYQAELEYGSIESIPEDDPRLINFQLRNGKRNSVEQSSVNGCRVRKVKFKKEMVEDIHKRWLDGERDIDIYHHTGISVATIYKYRSQFGKPNRNIWLLAKNGYQLAFESKADVVRFLGLSDGQLDERVYSRAERYGWEVSRKLTHEY